MSFPSLRRIGSLFRRSPVSLSIDAFLLEAHTRRRAAAADTRLPERAPPLPSSRNDCRKYRKYRKLVLKCTP